MTNGYDGIEKGLNGLKPSFIKISPVRREWSDLDITVLRCLVSYSVPYRDIAIILRRSYIAVQRKIFRLGICTRSFYSPDEISVIRKYAGKKTSVEIGLLINRSAVSVRNFCFLNGILLTRYGESISSSKLSDDDVFIIRQLHDEGVSVREIAFKFDVSRAVIYACCTSHKGKFRTVSSDYYNNSDRYQPGHFRKKRN